MKKSNYQVGVILVLTMFVLLTANHCKSQTNSNTEAATTSSNLSWTANLAGKQYIRVDGSVGTNGLKCVLEIENSCEFVKKPFPICFVNLVVTQTNHFNPCWTAYDTNYLEIELFDSEGKLVERTKVGENYQHFAPGQQIEELFQAVFRKSHRSAVARFAWLNRPDSGLDQFTVFSIPELFKLKRSGEYTLKVRMRLFSKDLLKARESEFALIPVSEATAKVQIQSNNNLPVNLSPLTKTNSPAK